MPHKRKPERQLEREQVTRDRRVALNTRLLLEGDTTAPQRSRDEALTRLQSLGSALPKAAGVPSRIESLGHSAPKTASPAWIPRQLRGTTSKASSLAVAIPDWLRWDDGAGDELASAVGSSGTVESGERSDAADVGKSYDNNGDDTDHAGYLEHQSGSAASSSADGGARLRSLDGAQPDN